MVMNAILRGQTAVFSSIAKEYIAVTEGIGVNCRSHLGRLKVSGADAIDLLNRLSTNKLDDLAVGNIQGTVLTTNKGRIIDLLYVLRQDDHLLVITGPDTCQRVSEWIDFYTFIEDVVVEDITDSTAMLSLVGANVPRKLASFAEIPPFSSVSDSLGSVDTLVLRTDFLGRFACDLIVAAEDEEALWATLTEFGALPVGSDALELLRIERGFAGYGSELCEDYNPLEAGLIDFISFNKGCYIGQEVVARLNTYDKVQRKLAGLSMQSGVPELPSDLLHDGRKIGALTSAVALHNGDGIVGLGYVRNAHAEVGERLLTADGIEVVVERVWQDD
ncbi:MAG: aminomethyl transferase family protein [Chloroflexi bacterium]|nr:aminomethyl transferase family protein [Chloroflexota bacterium]